MALAEEDVVEYLAAVKEFGDIQFLTDLTAAEQNLLD